MSLYMSFISLFFYCVFGPTETTSFCVKTFPHAENKIDVRQVSKHATKTKPQPPSHKRKMKPTLLLLPLVAIALMSGTEAQPIWNGEQSFDEMDDEAVGGVYYPETQPQQFDEMDEEAVGRRCRVYTDCDTFEFDELDDEEDECSTRNFDRVLVATVEITGRAPNPACARAVFDKICDQCEDNIQCYLKLGRQVGPKTRQCQPRRLRTYHRL